jgi:methyl-accepting chemotaxis protein
MTFAQEEQLLLAQRIQGERIMSATLAFLFICGLVVAAVTDSWAIAFVVGLPALLVPVGLSKTAAGSLTSRLAFALAFMIFSAQFIQQSQGMIEAHFIIFVLLAFLLYFRDWRPIVAAAGLIAVHHIVFNQLQEANTGIQVFNYGTGFGIVLLHALFVVFESVVLIYMAINLRHEAVEIAQVAQIASEVAAGRLKVESLDISDNRPLLRSVVGMQQQLLATFRSISEQAQAVHNTMVELGRHSRAVGQNMATQNNSAGAMSAAVDSLNSAVSQLADHARQASDLAHKSGESALNGAEVVKAAIAEMGCIAETIRSSASNVERLGAQSDRVVQVVGLIKDIAGQTNLLALNAAIEAARAGEQGRGFAVVADEVRKLAERTSQATEEIGGMMHEISDSKEATLSSIDEAVNRVGKGVELASAAGTSIDQITGAAGEVEQVISSISSALHEQSDVMRDIVRQVDSVASMAQNSHAAATSNIVLEAKLEKVGDRLNAAISRFSA